MTSSDITNIVNIRNEAPERIKILAASTPSGRHEEFWGWCVKASRKYFPSQEDIDGFKFSGYLYEHNKNGNGWTEVYAPSIVNRELLKINPDTEQSYLQDLKDSLTENRFSQEVIATFGEEEMGVYQKKYIEMAIEEGKRIGHKYTNEMSEEERDSIINSERFNSIKILGVDWDKYSSNTNMVCVELDKSFINENGVKEPKFKVLFREEIARGDFTYVNAVNKIIELNEIYNFDWITVDRGYGEMQLEILKKYGLDNPETGLCDKVIGYQFGEKIKVRDPHTGKVDNKPLKPFMVTTSVNVFEKGKIVFHPTDDKMAEQFGSYRIKAISSTGLPTFTDENEHMIDAVNLCLLTFEQKYGELMKQIITSRALLLKPEALKGKEADAVSDRSIAKKSSTCIPIKSGNGVVYVVPTKRKSSRSMSVFNRKVF